jgi:tetratricopeptide (TPR) repeat protein
MWKKISYRRSFFNQVAITGLVCVLTLHNGVAQDRAQDLFSNKEKTAEKLVEESNYAQALKIYKKIFSKHPNRIDISNIIGICYYKLKKPDKAVEFFELAIRNSRLNDISVHYYYMALNDMGRHEEAAELLSISPPLGIPRLCHSRFRVYPAQLTNFSEYPVALYDDGMFFISNRTIEQPVKKVVAATQSGMDRLFFSKLGEDGTLSNPVLFKQFEIQRPVFLHQGSLCFFEGNDKMIFSLSIRKDNMKTATPQLFLAQKTNDEWAITDSLFTRLPGSFSQPFIDEAAGRLYFVTDTPGGHGGTDIYFCNFNSDGFTEIENAGNVLNTPGNELFPFVNDGYLYFASNGHPGMGGLDLFRATIEVEGFGEIENLGPGINSNKDDFAIVFDSYGSRGFFSSSRGDNSGSDDIYHFYMVPESKDATTVWDGP